VSGATGTVCRRERDIQAPIRTLVRVYEALGDDTVPSTDRAADDFLGKVLEIASGEEAKHVREEPKDSNRGPMRARRAKGAACIG